MRFDWYQATVEEAPIWLQMALEKHLNGDAQWFEQRPLKGYSRGDELISGGQVLLELHSGGQHEWPHVVATGDRADDAAAMIRAIVPNHLVSRADVCEDMQAPGWFEKAHGTMVDLAREMRVKTARQGDWDIDFARTFYCGSPSSAVRVRAYEKGKELIAKYGPAAASEVPKDWCRLEVQVRPAKRESKLLMASIPAQEWWGCSRWSRRLADQLLGVEAPRLAVGTKYKRLDEFERTEYHLLKQYGRVFERMKAIHGSWEAVGRHIGHNIDRK